MRISYESSYGYTQTVAITQPSFPVYRKTIFSYNVLPLF